MPDSQQWLSIFSEALSQTIYAYNYEQIDPADLTPEQAAAAAYDVYTAWLDAQCASACLQPGGARVYRVNPTTNTLEFLEEEDWVTDDEIPGTEARTEELEEDRLCSAAANAVHVLKLAWVEGKELWDASVSYTDAQVDFAVLVTGLIGAAFYPPIVAIMGLTQLGWEIVYATYQLLNTVDWDDKFSEVLFCLFKDHATDTDGVVHFDINGIMGALWRKAFRAEAYLLMVAQVEYFIRSISPQGIDAAGALELVTGDCLTCDKWCYVWDFPNGPGNWYPVLLASTFNATSGQYNGLVWNSSHTIQDTTPTDSGHRAAAIMLDQTMHLTNIHVNYDRPTINYHGATGNVAVYVTVDGPQGEMGGTIVDWEDSPGSTGTGLQRDIELDADVYNIQVQVRCGYWPLNPAEPGGNCKINWIQLNGTGDNPFSEVDNCENE